MQLFERTKRALILNSVILLLFIGGFSGVVYYFFSLHDEVAALEAKVAEVKSNEEDMATLKKNLQDVSGSKDSSISDIVKNSPSRQALVSNYERLSEWRKQRVLKKIKKPLEDHLRDMDDAIEDAEREVEKYETKEVLSDTEKNRLKVAKKQLAALHKEQRSAQETYDKIIETGDTEPRKRGTVDVDVKDNNSDDVVDAEIVSRKKNREDYTSDETETPEVKSISNDNESKGSVEYLKKLSSDKNSDEDNNETDKEPEK
jgi:uncharacterized protein (DUF2164 family)